MKRIFAAVLSLMLAVVLLACAAPAAPQPAAAEAATEAPAEPAEPVEPAAPEATVDPNAPYFIVSYEDGTPVPDRIEGKAGKDNALNLYFAMENAEGMIGWDGGAFEAAGIFTEMNFEHLNEKGLLVTVWSEGPAECANTFFINGSGDWANPEVLFEKEFTLVFTA